MTIQTARSKDGTTIAFERTGSGPTLVLVGGAMSGRSGAADIASHLAGDFTVVTYDRRGRGDSTDTAPYAVEREIEDLDALIAANGGSAFVFGHSSGGMLALRAAEAGLPIDKLAVYEPPVIVDDSRTPAPEEYIAHIEELVAAGRRGDAVEYFLVDAVQVPAAVVAGMRAAPMWSGMEAMAHTLPYDGRVMGDASSGSSEPIRRFASLTVPTLVLDGGASPTWMHNGARLLANTIPNAEARTLAGQDHGAAPSVLAPVLVEFFS